MGNNFKLRLAVRAALAMASAASAMPAMSQVLASATAATPSGGLEEVIVTGSRIQAPNITAISPITTVTAIDIQGTNLTRAEDILNNLPMVFSGQNSNVSNGADGTATVNLRGLGPQRTLVLVNGRRLGPGAGDGRNYSDINQVPAALIDRVDIETGGASSVYGADAVAGVVNFVLNTHFEGVRVDTSYDFYQHSNGNSVAQYVGAAGDTLPEKNVDTGFGKNVSVLMGSNFADNKGNATFYATYDRAAAVLQAKYDYSACVLDATKAGALKCGGSGTSAKNGAGGYFQAYGSSGALFTNTVDGKTGQFRPFNFATDLYNFGPLNFYQRPNERTTAGSFVNYDVNDHLNVYSEFMFSRNTSQAQVAASGDFFQSTFIPCSDPLLTAQEQSIICSPANLAAQGNPTQTIGGATVPGLNLYIGRRNVEGGGRVATFQSDSARLVLGVKGEIVNGITFDVSAQRGTVDGNNANLNYFSNANIINALDVVANPTTGAATCASVINGTDKKCVPWNIWVPGGVTAAATNYLSIPLLIQLTTTEQVVTASVTGDLGKYGVKLPTAEDGLKANLGAEYRSESAVFSPDLESQLGNAAGSGGPVTPVAGDFHVGEVFMEFGMPLVDHAFLAESLAIEGGYRYSDYNLGFKTNTYKGGLEWKPVKDLRVRASYQRAVRAPNIGELFTPQAVVLDGSTDPCSGPVGANGLVASGATQAQCVLAGVSTAQYGHVGANPAGQYNGILGGNTGLGPEKSDTYSAGLVITPEILPSFSMSIDYFNIKLNDTIGPIGADTILANCISSGSAAYCGAIHRDANGSLWKTNNGYVSDTDVNFGSLTTRGVDIKTNYRQELPAFGALTFSLEGTRLMNLGTQPLTGGPAYDCAGYFGTTCGASNPHWRHVLNTTWLTPWSGLDLTLRWRYIGAAQSEQDSSNAQLSGNALPLTSHIGAYNYFDLSSQITLYKTIRMQVGINNVADKDPPIIASKGGPYTSDCPTITANGSSCNGNTFPSLYDALGRYFFARLTAQF